MKPVFYLSLLLSLNPWNIIRGQSSYFGINSGLGTWEFNSKPAGILSSQNEKLVWASSQPSYIDFGIHYSIEFDSAYFGMEIKFNHKHKFHKSLSTNYLQATYAIWLNIISDDNFTFSLGIGPHLSTVLLNKGELDKIQSSHFRKLVFGYYVFGSVGYNFNNENSIAIRNVYQSNITTAIINNSGSKDKKKHWTSSIGLELKFSHKINSNLKKKPGYQRSSS